MRGILMGIWAAVSVLGNFVRDGIEFLRSCVSSRTSLAAENIFLRKQLFFYQEHQIRPRRLTNSARVALVFWSRFFEWRSALLIVKASDLDWLAPQSVQALLEMEIPIRSPALTKGPSSAHCKNGL
jgi:hypothetical protein